MEKEWEERFSGKKVQRGKIERNPYGRDKARIIHSAVFRRLQAKTQVLNPGDSDFYRTRLTHSLEVAQIASGVTDYLKHLHQYDSEIQKWLPSSALIEAVGLAHDLGHPPFGHGGEIALNYAMREAGGFEGNGQTLRILTRMGEFDPDYGLDMTRRSLLGILKYPALWSEVENFSKARLSEKLETHDVEVEYWRPPKCILDSEKDILEWMLKPFSKSDYEKFRFFKLIEKPRIPGKLEKANHYKTQHKAFDTSIMEIADDIAYGIHDLEDAVMLRLVNQRQWEEELVHPLLQIPGSKLALRIEEIGQELFTPKSFHRKNAIGELVSYFVEQASVIRNEDFEHPLLKLNATLYPYAQSELGLFKQFIAKNVIHQPELSVLMFKGQHMILRMFKVLEANAESLLPRNIYSKYQVAEEPKRILCDYIAGMTDNYASRMYQKLFSPGVGSVFDRL
jgi:dGTPase